MADPWKPLLALACALLGSATLVSLAWRLRTHRRLGGLVHAAGAGRGARWWLSAAALASAAWLLAAAPGPALPALAALALAVSATWLRPAAGEERCGTAGVQRGWQTASFAELAEWRLAGEHLRFRIGDRWLAVRLPSSAHAALRERLSAQAAGRESPWR